jgi:hypothetical protein
MRISRCYSVELSMLSNLWIFVVRSFYVVKPDHEAQGQVSMMYTLLICDVLGTHVSGMNCITYI